MVTNRTRVSMNTRLTIPNNAISIGRRRSRTTAASGRAMRTRQKTSLDSNSPRMLSAIRTK
ncbi:hypothetical protein D3C72_2181800 [compost metagenome]